ncbi:hypothetical protein POM88_011116 [Heracleum sosnowskyi]|uniref:Uncharacterized protein n=1 Tax=Heracleum sosnowskyi TaxID=360622 RepID=A0AAD8IUD8_9APIA|nr:hypothetical protein POM88_011116 [Heracleum sosnowskyi]
MAGEFIVTKTNHVSFQNLQSITNPQIRAWAEFLNTRSLVAYAVSTPVVLCLDQLTALYTTATDTSENNVRSFSFVVPGGRTIRVTEHDFNRILHFPTENLVPDPSTEEIHAFFTLIRSQQPNFLVGEFLKHYLPKPWNFFFHTLIHVFTAKLTNLHGIPLFLQKIGFAIANNRHINIGRIVIDQVVMCMGPLDERTGINEDVLCFYPRFLQLILNDVLTDDERETFEPEDTMECTKMKSNAITALIRKNNYLPGVPTVLTEYLRTVPLPLLPPGEQVIQGNIPELELAPEPQPMDVDPEPSVAIPDQEVANPQPLTTVEEPLNEPNENINDAPSPPIPSKETSLSVEGDSAKAAPHKEIHPSTAALPSSKRRRTETEATADTSFLSFKEPFTDFSDADWATLTKAISEPIAQSSKEELTEATGVPTILRSGSLVEGSLNQGSSQTSREGFDLNAQSKRSLSTSPDGTYLDPAGKGSDVGADRQLVDSESITIEESTEVKSLQTHGEDSGSLLLKEPVSNPLEIQTLDPTKDISSKDDQQLGLTKDGDLRSPIAPSVTSLRTATVFSSAGTTSTMDLSETQTLTPGLSGKGKMSETPTETVSEHPEPNVRSDTQTLTHIDDLLLPTERELQVQSSLKEMTVHDTEGNPLFKVPLRPSFDQGITSSQDNVSLKSIQEKVDLAAADSRRTFRVIGSASGTITGTKQAVDSLKKEAMEELVDLRMDVRELKDGFMNEVTALSQGHEALKEDVLVIRDGQARVKDAMDNLSRVESRLNRRLDHMEKTTNSRLENIDLSLASINDFNKQLMDFLENQGDGVQSIWSMLKNQQSGQPGPSYQQPDPSNVFYAEDAFIEDSSTKGDKVGEGEKEQTKDGWRVWETVEAIPIRQYWIEELVEEEKSEEEFEFMQEQPIQEEHEPYYPEPIEHPILDEDIMEEESNSLSPEEEAALEAIRAQRAAIDARQAEKEKQQAILRSEKLKRMKVYNEVRKKKMIDLAKKDGTEWEMAYKTFCGVEDGLQVNDNAEVEVIIQDIRSANLDDQTYFKALRSSIICLNAGVKANGAWSLLISFLEKGTFVISTKFLEQRTYTELQAILIKIQRTTRLNELLREHVKEIVMKVSPEITEDPPMVRFMTNDLFRICYLAEDKLRDYPSNYLISVEKYLRSTGFSSTEKDKAADTLRRFLMENVPYYRKRVERGLEVHTRLPNMPKPNKKDVNIAWLWAGVGQEVEYIGRHIRGAILKPGEPLHYPSVIDYQAANSDPMIEEGEIGMD